MIFTNPTDKVLQTAHAIALIDKNWREDVVKLTNRQPGTNYVIVEIPVDSKDSAALKAWRDKIKAARK